MTKYLVLYTAPTSASETMATATPEQMKASMDEWIAWRDAASKTATIDFGLPLQSVGRITQDGVTASTSQVSGYATIEGESKDAIMALLRTHPHLRRPGATIEVLEMLPMPGL